MRYFYSGQMRSTRLPKTQYTGWSNEQSHWMECASLCLPIVFHETKQKTKKLNRRLGTGEHDVGLGKKEYLVEELGIGTGNSWRQSNVPSIRLDCSTLERHVFALFLLHSEADPRWSDQLYPDTSSMGTDKHAD